jgi:hypothetical protein
MLIILRYSYLYILSKSLSMLTIIRYSYVYYIGIISVNSLIAPHAPERHLRDTEREGGTKGEGVFIGRGGGCAHCDAPRSCLVSVISVV